MGNSIHMCNQCDRYAAIARCMVIALDGEEMGLAAQAADTLAVMADELERAESYVRQTRELHSADAVTCAQAALTVCEQRTGKLNAAMMEFKMRRKNVEMTLRALGLLTGAPVLENHQARLDSQRRTLRLTQN